MTREEAIVFLDDIMTDCVYGITNDEKESCKMAIEALKEPPRVHAHWIEDEPYHNEEGEFIPQYYCSVCGRYEDEKEPFCNCGAIMDEEKKD